MNFFWRKIFITTFLLFVFFCNWASAQVVKKIINKTNREVSKVYDSELGESLPNALKIYQTGNDSALLKKAYSNLSTNFAGYGKRRMGRSYTVNLSAGSSIYASLDEGLLHAFKNAPDLIQKSREKEAQKFKQYGPSRNTFRLFLPYIHTTTGSLVFVDELERQIDRYKRHPEIEKRHRIIYYSLLFINYSVIAHSDHSKHARYKEYVHHFNAFLGERPIRFRYTDTRTKVTVTVQTMGIIHNALGVDKGVLSAELSESLNVGLHQGATYSIYSIDMNVNRELSDENDLQVSYEKSPKPYHQAEAICFSRKYTACLAEVGLHFIDYPQEDKYGLFHLFATKNNKLLHYVLDPSATEYSDSYDRSEGLLLKVEEIGAYEEEKSRGGLEGLWLGQGQFSFQDSLVSIDKGLGSRRQPISIDEIPAYSDALEKRLANEISVHRMVQLVATPRFLIQSSAKKEEKKKVKEIVSRSIERVVIDLSRNYSIQIFDEEVCEDLSNLAYIAQDFLNETTAVQLVKGIDDKITFYLRFKAQKYPDTLVGHSDFLNGIEEAKQLGKFSTIFDLYKIKLRFKNELNDLIDTFFSKRYPQVKLPLHREFLEDLAIISELYHKYHLEFRGLLKNVKLEISRYVTFLKYSLPQISFLEDIQRAIFAIEQLKNLNLGAWFSLDEVALRRSFSRLFLLRFKQKSRDELESSPFKNLFVTYIRSFKHGDYKDERHELVLDVLTYYGGVNSLDFSRFQQVYVKEVERILHLGLYSPEPNYENYESMSLLNQINKFVRSNKIDLSPLTAILDKFIVNTDYLVHSGAKAAAFLCLAAMKTEENFDFSKLFLYLDTRDETQINAISNLLSKHKEATKVILFKALKNKIDLKLKGVGFQKTDRELSYQIAKRIFQDSPEFKQLESELIKKNVDFIKE